MMKLGIFVLLAKFVTLALCQLNEEERIKNGQEVSGGDFSFTAKLQLKDKHICNAMLVDSRWVVTLKNCIDKKKLSQYKVYMSSSGSKGTDVMRTVLKLVVADTKNDDVIMLQLNKEVLENTDKVKVLNRFSTATLDKKMKKCKVVGFSENGKRQREVTATLLKPSKKCKGKDKLCFNTKSGSVCKVDNGSPVVCQYKSKWYLTGSSFVKKKCTNKNINGFKLSFYSSAIQKVVKDNEVIKDCGPAPDVDNANVLLSNDSSKAEVTCYQGYETNKTVLNCLGKKWENTTCKVIETDDYVVRLPDNVTPTRYAIELQPDIYDNTKPEEFTFNGSVIIFLQCLKDTSIITLNMDELSIQGPIIVKLKDNSENLYKKHAIDKNQQFLYILTEQYLRSGEKYILRINNFVGDLKTSDNGFFYGYNMEEQQYFAATRFQAMSARTAFPCFDEPAIKSQFDVTLLRKYTVLSLTNMYLVRSTNNRSDGWIEETFARTPDMSVYHLAFFVGNYNSRSKFTSDSVQYVTWTKPSARNQTVYVLETGVKLQEFYEDYFNIQFPLLKQDNIAIPNYDKPGIESWGLNSYSDKVMLVEEEKSSVADLRLATTVTANVIAHAWVGNLVSCHWWDDIWLNEGFARYYQYTGVDFVQPEWKMWDQFIHLTMQPSLAIDGKVNLTHPLHNPVYRPSKDINDQIFTSISSDKGAAVLRMLSFIVGQNTFKEGVKEYIKQYSYKAVTPDNLYSAIEKQANIDKRSITNIKEIMDTWVLQKHFPLVEVEFTTEGKITLTQKRYEETPGGADPGDSPYGYKWNIPFAYTTSTKKNFLVRSKDIIMMPLNKQKVTIKDKSIPKPKGNQNWVIGNPNQFGYYRVKYDKRNWNALMEQLVSDHTVIDVMNRAQLIEDAWYLNIDGYQGLTIALRSLQYLRKEEEWLPWVTAEKWINYIGNRVESMPEYYKFKDFAAKRTEKMYKKFANLNKYTDIELLLKNIITKLACTYGLVQCESDTQQKLEKWRKDPDNKSDKNINGAAYCGALTDADTIYWDFVFEQFKKENTEARLEALACSSKQANLERLLNYYNKSVSSNESLELLFTLAKYPTGRSVAWDYVRDSWDSWIAKLTGSEIGSYLKKITNEFATGAELKKLEAFKTENADDISKDSDLEADLNEITGDVKKRNEWANTNFPIVQSWLDSLVNF